MVRDITAGDCVEMAELLVGMAVRVDTSAYFYQLLHAMGVFPESAPPTVRAVSGRAQGQISVEQMIDRYQIACRPIRDVLVDYRAGTPTLAGLHLAAGAVVRPGQIVLEGPGDPPPWNRFAAPGSRRRGAWKHRIAKKTTRRKNAGAGRRGRGPSRRPRGSTTWRWCGPSISTSPSGPSTIPPAGACGPLRAPFARRKCPERRTAPAASRASTKEPANACRSYPLADGRH